MPGPGRRPPPPPPEANGDARPPLPSRPGPTKPTRLPLAPPKQAPKLPERNNTTAKTTPPAKGQGPQLPARPPHHTPPVAQPATPEEEIMEDTYLLPVESNPNHPSNISDAHHAGHSSDEDGWDSSEFDDEDPDVVSPKKPKSPASYNGHALPSPKFVPASENGPALPSRKPPASNNSPALPSPKPPVSNGGPALPPPRPQKEPVANDLDSSSEHVLYEVPEGGEPANLYEFPIGLEQILNRSKKTSREEQKQESYVDKGSSIQDRIKNIQGASHNSAARKPLPLPKPKPTGPAPPPKKPLPSLPQGAKPGLNKPLPDLPSPMIADSGSDDCASAGSVSSESGRSLPPPPQPGSLVARLKDELANKVQVLPCLPAMHPALKPPSLPHSTSSKNNPLPPVPTEEPDEIYDDCDNSKLTLCTWYHGNIDRSTGRQKLMEVRPCVNGNFLIRDSTKSKYTLMVWAGGKDYNLNIRERRDSRYALGSAKDDEISFGDLAELVQHHKENDLTVIEQQTSKTIFMKLQKTPVKN